VSLHTDPVLSTEVEALARKIAGPEVSAEIKRLANRIAEAQVDLKRVREARHSIYSSISRHVVLGWQGRIFADAAGEQDEEGYAPQGRCAAAAGRRRKTRDHSE
jgi:hypothetical protein